MSEALTSRFLSRGAALVVAVSFVLAGCSEMLSRDDFAARVKDKSDSEVAKLVGKPVTVDTSKPDQVIWIYNSRTFNIEGGNKFDTKTIVVFNKAGSGQLKATDVNFE